MEKEGNGRLDSWKEIARYLGRDVTTAIRWERQKGLPVHRVSGGKRSAVCAFTQEIDAWLKNGKPTFGVGKEDEASRDRGGKPIGVLATDSGPPAPSAGQDSPETQTAVPAAPTLPSAPSEGVGLALTPETRSLGMPRADGGASEENAFPPKTGTRFEVSNSELSPARRCGRRLWCSPSVRPFGGLCCEPPV